MTTRRCILTVFYIQILFSRHQGMIIFFTDIKVATADTEGNARFNKAVEIASATFKKVKITGNFL